MRKCVCDNCGMEFELESLDANKETLRDGTLVEVISFTCPKCDERYIVSVKDEIAVLMQRELKSARDLYRTSFDPKDPGNADFMHKTKRDIEHMQRQLGVYKSKLKKKYLKELKKRGY